MAGALTKLGEDFWRVEGDFRIGGLLNLGTQASLVRLGDGNFVFLDSYTLSDSVKAEVDLLTDGGGKLAAILNLHPFHTLHCEWMHRTFPSAKLYGTRRHHEKFPDLPWESALCEADALPELFGEDFAFSVPDGVALVCEDENVHFSSVLAYHRASGTIHSDDTLSRIDLPFPLSALPLSGRLDFHPTLGKALKPVAGAADAFREWAIELGIAWADARRIATAHNSVLEFTGKDFPTLLGEALGRVGKTLDKHRAEYG